MMFLFDLAAGRLIQTRYYIDICVVYLQGKDTPSSEGIVAWRVILKQILLRADGSCLPEQMNRPNRSCSSVCHQLDS
jgi:hypothetical protein